MLVRVGIVSWNTAALLDRCLAALPAALGRYAADAEVVVVDNASSDGSAEVASAHTAVTVVASERNDGYGRAMNVALEHGRPAEVLVALNPDTAPPPGSLEVLIDRLLAADDVALVSPRLVGDDGREQQTAYRFPSVAVALGVCLAPVALLRRGLGRRWWLEGHSDHRVRADVDWTIGAVHVLRAAALPVGSPPYDERWFMYSEDLDLCWRLHDLGWRVRLEGDVDVVHTGNAAGVQAWGDDRTMRWLVPTYDVYARTRGTFAARRWAAANVVGVSWVIAKWRLLARLAPSRWGHGRSIAVGLHGPLVFHLAVVRRGVAAAVASAPNGPPAPGAG